MPVRKSDIPRRRSAANTPIQREVRNTAQLARNVLPVLPRGSPGADGRPNHRGFDGRGPGSPGRTPVPRTRALQTISAALSLLTLSSCTSMIGFPVARPGASGEPDVVRVCAALDTGAHAAEVESQLERWNRAHTGDTGIRFELVQSSPLPRSGRSLSASGNEYPMGRLEAPCDRQIYLVRGNRADYLGGVLATVVALPLILGCVDDNTGTAAMVQTSWVAPILQLGSLMSPTDVFQHELWHLLGCPHAFTRTECYERIRILRESYRQGDGSFFPAMSPVGNRTPIRTSRDAVNCCRRMPIPVGGS